MLTFVDDSGPGIKRSKVRHGWGYWDVAGKRIGDRDEIDRLNAIGLPPAYTDAWFCPDPNGHIQATGFDARRRKQYRYHVDFRARQEAQKYNRLADFGRGLPKLRKAVARDLGTTGISKAKAVAAVVRLLDLGRLRVGNERYAKSNKSFGATTLRGRHAELKGARLSLQYRAKSGKLKVLTITDRRLAAVVRRCQDLPGQHLFGYLDDAGEAHPVTSTDVNAYIREATGSDFTAKHFRTWGATLLAYQALRKAGARGISLKAMLEPVTEALGNTPAVARRSYVHPALIALAQTKEACVSASAARLRGTRYLTAAERGLIALLGDMRGAGETRKAA